MIFTSLFAFSLSSSLLRFAAEPSQRTHDSGSPLCDAASLFGDDDDEGLSLLQLNARSLQKPAESSKLSAQGGALQSTSAAAHAAWPLVAAPALPIPTGGLAENRSSTTTSPPPVLAAASAAKVNRRNATAALPGRIDSEWPLAGMGLAAIQILVQVSHPLVLGQNSTANLGWSGVHALLVNRSQGGMLAVALASLVFALALCFLLPAFQRCARPHGLTLRSYSLQKPETPSQGDFSSHQWHSSVVMAFSIVTIAGLSANLIVVLAPANVVVGGNALSGIDLFTGAYGVGALLGLCFFASLPAEKLWTAYRWQAAFMMLGNLGIFLVQAFPSPLVSCSARLLVGLAGGGMYSAMHAFCRFARDAALSSCFILAQIYVGLGILAGPAIAALSIRFGHVGAWITTSASLTSGVMAIWGALQLLALCVAPLPALPAMQHPPAGDIATPRRAFAASFDANGSKFVRPSSPRSAQFALVLTVVCCAVLSMAQRIFVENGMIFLLKDRYDWSDESTQMSLAITCVAMVAAQAFTALCSYFSMDQVSDARLMWYMELLQMVSMVFLMVASYAAASPLPLLVCGSVLYCANTVWAGASMGFCLKRHVSGSKAASLEKLLAAHHLALLLGIPCGGVASVVIFRHHASVLTFALLMLVSCVLQSVTRVLSS